MKKNKNGVIFGYYVQICLVIVFIVVSYFLFTESRLADFAKTANAYDTMNLNFMISYDRDKKSLINSDTLLDKGTLAIRNPNKKDTNATVNLLISKNAKLDEVEFVVNGEKVNMDNMSENKDYYVVSLDNRDFLAYEDATYSTLVVGNPYHTQGFSYTFDVVESF